MKPNTRHALYPWTCWIVAAFTYLFAYGLLVFPSAITPQLHQTLGLSEAEIGVFSSAYLYTFVLMQIPVGLMFDKLSSQKILLTSCALLIMGTIILAVSHDFFWGVVSRLLMGLGASFTFIGAIYLGKTWFSVSMFPIIVGLTEAMSGFGELGLQSVFAALKRVQDWRVIILEVGFAIFLLSLIIMFHVRDKASLKRRHTPSILSELKVLLRNHRLWLLGLYAGLAYAHFIVMVTMWNVSVLTLYYHIDTVEAVFVNSFAVMGFTIGCLLIGSISHFISEKRIMLFCSLLQVPLLILFIYIHFKLIYIALLLFSLGLITSCVVLTFDLAKRVVPESSYGIASGFINMLYVGVGMLATPLVGYFLGITDENIHISATPLILFSVIALIIAISFNVSKDPYLHRSRYDH